MIAATSTVVVPVDGGSLHVGVWGDADAPAVIAAHGITSSHLFWALVGPMVAKEGLSLWAPDLRGRGASADVGGASLAQHADDLLAIGRRAPAWTGLLVGHSMGGFVAATAAQRHAESVRGMVLVDGGPPLGEAPGPDVDIEATLHAVIGPALERLGRVFATPEDYVDFWRAHPAMATVDDGLLDAYARHDLVEAGEGWQPRADRESVVADGRDTLASPEVRAACEHLAAPARLLVAERGMLDGPEPLYSAAAVRDAAERRPDLRVRHVPDVNHYTIGLRDHGARAIVEELIGLHAQIDA